MPGGARPTGLSATLHGDINCGRTARNPPVLRDTIKSVSHGISGLAGHPSARGADCHALDGAGVQEGDSTHDGFARIGLRYHFSFSLFCDLFSG